MTKHPHSAAQFPDLIQNGHKHAQHIGNTLQSMLFQSTRRLWGKYLGMKSDAYCAERCRTISMLLLEIFALQEACNQPKHLFSMLAENMYTCTQAVAERAGCLVSPNRSGKNPCH